MSAFATIQAWVTRAARRLAALLPSGLPRQAVVETAAGDKEDDREPGRTHTLSDAEIAILTSRFHF